MVDVIHYMFETDAESILTGEQAEARDALRSYLYTELYGREYKYASPKLRSGVTGKIDEPLGDDYLYEDMPKPVDPFERSGGGSSEVKPYIKPTTLDPGSSRPFGNVLDAPLG